MNTARVGRPDHLRISYLFSHFPQPTEGFAVSDIVALRKLGHEVFVHTMRPPRGDESDREKAARIPEELPILRPALSLLRKWPKLLWRKRSQVYRISVKSLRAIIKEPKAAIVSLLCIPRALEIVEEIDKLDSDVVHLFWSRYAANVLAALEGSGSMRLRSAFVGAYDLVANDHLVATAISSAQTVFSHSESNRHFLVEKGASDSAISIIHRGIPLQQLDDNLHRDANLLVTASALVEQKNVRAIIETFARAQSKRPALKLEICGDGPERSRLESLARELGCADSVRFLGHVEREKVFALFQRAELCLFLSTKPSERLPNVLKEAMWCGCSIIASPTQGIEELIVDRQLGTIVDPTDIDALDRAVANAFEETEAAAMARRERARDLISDKFSSLTSMAQYAEVWRNALDEIGGARLQRNADEA